MAYAFNVSMHSLCEWMFLLRGCRGAMRAPRWLLSSLIPAARVMNHWKEKRRGHLKKELETVANAIAKAKFGQRKAAKHRKENAKLSEKLKALD